MPANVESMFYVRETPWHGLGERVEGALNSKEAIIQSGLDWNVIKKDLFINSKDSEDDSIVVDEIGDWVANVRESDDRVLGIVTPSYRIVQNVDAFNFTDELLGHGVTYETAGSLDNGRKIWLLAKLTTEFKVLGDLVEPYLVFANSHDGTGALKIAITPVRVVCQNTLNLALSGSKRMWTTKHTGDIHHKLKEAERTLIAADDYMNTFIEEAEILQQFKISKNDAKDLTELLLPYPEEAGDLKKSNIDDGREEILYRYMNAPDLVQFIDTGWGYINSVSDFATHTNPKRLTSTYKEKLFAKTIGGNNILDKAYEIVNKAMEVKV